MKDVGVCACAIPRAPGIAHLKRGQGFDFPLWVKPTSLIVIVGVLSNVSSLFLDRSFPYHGTISCS